MEIELTNRQVKEADRPGGIVMLMLWPDDVPAPERMPDDIERRATAAEHARAERMTRSACERHRLVPVRTVVLWSRRPGAHSVAPPYYIPRPDETLPHLGVILIGYRWVHATGHPQPRYMWHFPRTP